MKIGVLGSGNGGCAVAFDWAEKGHDVYLFDFEEFPENIKAINEKRGIKSTGILEGFAKLKYAGHDIGKVIEDSEIIFVVGPAYSTEPFARVAKPFIKEGQIVVVCPSSCGGSIVFKNALNLELQNKDYIIAETSTLPYAVRVTEPGSINIFLKLKGGLYISALPHDNTDKVYNPLKEVYPALEVSENVFQTTLQNANPVIHPAVTLLNSALIERTNGDFNFYEDGVTRSVGRLIKGIDDERVKIGKRLNLKIIKDPLLGMKQGYMQEESYDTGYSKANGFKGIKAQSQLENRYFTEDVGYGLIFMSDLAKQIGVETPNMDSIITIVSTIMDRDYRSEKNRTMKSLGLEKYNLEELLNIL